MIWIYIVIGFPALIIFLIVFNSFKLWLQALVSNAPVSLISIIRMPFRKINPGLIVYNYIVVRRAGLSISVNELITHYLAQGNVTRVVQTLVAASKANITLDFKKAAAIDLAGHDILDAINASVNPKVIDARGSTAKRQPSTPWPRVIIVHSHMIVIP